MFFFYKIKYINFCIDGHVYQERESYLFYFGLNIFSDWNKTKTKRKASYNKFYFVWLKNRFYSLNYVKWPALTEI